MLQFKWKVAEADDGKSAGALLQIHFGCSASMVKTIRLHGELLINGIPSRMKTICRNGDRLEASLASVNPASLHFPAEQIPLWQNDWLLAMSKKPGQTVHPSLNRQLEDLCTLISDEPLHPVNRLDRDTSGLVLIALNGHAHYRLIHTPMEKKYLALIHGRMPQKEGRISCPIGRSPDSLIVRVPDLAGKAAATLWKEIDFYPDPSFSLVEFTLLSGRTHQIRLHSLYMGRPLLGDTLYGLNQLPEACTDGRIASLYAHDASLLAKSESARILDSQIDRQALHAAQLSFIDPMTKKRIVLNDPLPEDMQTILTHYREKI